MRRHTDEAGAHLWGVVTATVRPLRRRGQTRIPTPAPAPTPATLDIPADPAPSTTSRAMPPTGRNDAKATMARPHVSPPQSIEPGRRRRLDRGRDQPAASLDLHGLTQDLARVALRAFLLRGFAENRRIILVITGKGALGDGVLRRRVPEWLAEPPLRQVVAGLSEAHRRHGGEGALYVALKRAEGR